MVYIYENDLDGKVDLGDEIAIDTETMGLRPGRDRLCLVQIADAKGVVHMVQFKKKTFKAPNLVKVLNNKKVKKIFHYARFDIAVLMYYLGCQPQNIFCTKIASLLSRTYTDRHGLKALVKELLEIEMEKGEQTSYWGTEKLTQKQIDYAASDVLHLHKLKEVLTTRLAKENRLELAQTCMDFVIHRAQIDLDFGEEFDVFAHRLPRN